MQDLPEEYKRYVIKLSDKTEFRITGEEKDLIMRRTDGFIELKSGEVLNRAFITSITLDFARIKADISRLPHEKRLEVKKMIDAIDAKEGLLL